MRLPGLIAKRHFGCFLKCGNLVDANPPVRFWRKADIQIG
jgi:hypothetical protein